MTRKLKLFALLMSVSAPWLVTTGASSANEVFEPKVVIDAKVLQPTGTLNSWDIGFIDPALRLYFLADRTNASIDVVDTSTNKLKEQFFAGGGFRGLKPCPSGTGGANDCAGPNGVLIADEEVWVGDSPSKVWVLKLDGTVVAKIDTALDPQKGDETRADELCFDPQHHLILVANDASSPAPFVTFIDSRSHAVLGHIVMDGKNGRPNATNGIEQCQWSPRSKKFYLNLPEVDGPGDNSKAGAVLMINPASMKIEKTFKIPHEDCTGPQGMAIGPDREILLGCNNQTGKINGTTEVVFSPGSVIINELTGDIVHKLPGLGGNDEVWYNPGDNQYFLAGGSHVAKTPSTAGSDPILGVVDVVGDQKGTLEDASAPTANGSHSVAADPVFNEVYVPANKAATKFCGDSNGCIVVFAAKGDDTGICLAEGSPVVRAGQAGPVFLRAVCPPGGGGDED